MVDVNDELTRILHRNYGFGHEKEILEALEYWSEAIRELPPSGEEQCGAFRVGPSFPFSIAGSYMYPADKHSKGYFMTSAYKPHNGSHQSSVCPSGRRIAYQRAKLVRMLDLLIKGRCLLDSLSIINDDLERLINLGRYMECIVTTGINAKDWYNVVARLPISDDKDEIERLITEAERIIDSERANVERALPLVERDSRLGWDPRMEYVCDPARLNWKLKLLDYVRGAELDKYRLPNRFADNYIN